MRAIGVHVQTKVRETGFKVDLDGQCWASPATTASNADVEHQLWPSSDPALATEGNSHAAPLEEEEEPHSRRQQRQQWRRRRRPRPNAASSFVDAHFNRMGLDGDNINIQLPIDSEEEAWEDEQLMEEGDTFYGLGDPGGGRCRSEAMCLRRRRRRQQQGRPVDIWQSTPFGEQERIQGSQTDVDERWTPRLELPPCIEVYGVCRLALSA